MFGGHTEYWKFRAYDEEAGIDGGGGRKPGKFWCNPATKSGTRRD